MNLFLIRLKILLRSNWFFIILFSLVLFHLCFKSPYYYTHQTKHITGVVISHISYETYQVIILKAKEKVQIEYTINHLKPIHIGDILTIEGNFVKPSTNRNFKLFSYQNYLKGKQINWICKATHIKIIGKSKNPLYHIKQILIDRLQHMKHKAYYALFILGDSTYLNKEQKSNFQKLGISHLFAISGMHVSLFTIVLLSLLKKITQNKKVQLMSITIFLISYTFLTDFNPSIVRASLLWIALSIKKEKHWKIPTSKLLLIIGLLMLLKNPNYFYHIGFQFSFLVSYTLIRFSRNQYSYIIQLFYTSCLSFFTGLPILIQNFHSVNFLTPIWNLFFVPFVSFLIFPCSILSFLFPILEKINSILIVILETLTSFCSQFSKLTISFPTFPKFFFLLLFFFLFKLFSNPKKKRNWLMVVLFLVLHYNQHFFLNYTRITAIDVGQGDCTLIELKRNHGNILIDTGGSYITDEKKSIAFQIIIPYLQAIGIHKLDYLILSHGDYDHAGETIRLLQNFPVKHIIMNSGHDNKIEQAIKKEARKRKIPVDAISTKQIQIHNNNFYFINDIDHQNENEDSLILYTKLEDWNIVLMGDAGEESEKYILNTYSLPKMDIVKIGHHGSRTSSSISFLQQIQPKYAVIEVGVENRFHHPHNETIYKLRKTKTNTYLTSSLGMIQIILKKQIEIRTRFSVVR